uniref:Gamma-glutamyltranspeptidase / glutathione hydrolase / leukotriene-C4 hydrolase n=1 Tax=Rhipicephalus zambeziensis TaxID=60191 RepID=A0A224YYL6_9ACAR
MVLLPRRRDPYGFLVAIGVIAFAIARASTQEKELDPPTVTSDAATALPQFTGVLPESELLPTTAITESASALESTSAHDEDAVFTDAQSDADTASATPLDPTPGDHEEVGPTEAESVAAPSSAAVCKCPSGGTVDKGFSSTESAVDTASEYVATTNTASTPLGDVDDVRCGEPTADTTASDSTLGNFSHWAVATDAAPCAGVTRNIMKKGGNLADAAVATMLCMGVVLPHSMGIGGGFMATIYLRRSKKAMTLIARERAPGAATWDMFVGNETLARRGGLSVAVPGELRGYRTLLRELHATLKWREHFDDAIRLARYGFPVGRHLAAALQQHKDDLSDSLKKVFWNETTNDTLAEGDLLVQPDLADTLEVIANKGPDYFYKGGIGEQMAKEIQDDGGVITKHDLKSYEAQWKRPIVAHLSNGNTLYTVATPGSGAVLTGILRVSIDALERYNSTVDQWHRFIEACKHAYGGRSHLADSDFADVKELEHNMTTPEWAAAVGNLINESTTFDDPAYYGFLNNSSPEDGGTAHATFWGDNGDVIVITSTINNYFGSKLRTSSGVILNNQMDDFATPGMSNSYDIYPSSPNSIEPGKRPLSSMVPSVFVDCKGDAVLALGGTGGPEITTAVALVALRSLWGGYDIKEAIDLPRLHHQLIPNRAVVEPDFPQEIIAELESKGHVFEVNQGNDSTVNGIKSEANCLHASYDLRRGGGIDGE